MKNKKMKVMALGMALAMSTMWLASCGEASQSVDDRKSNTEQSDALDNSKAKESNTEEKDEGVEEVNLTWLLRIPEQADQDEVLDAVNEILKSKINATLDITYIDAAAYPEKTKLKIASQEEFDLMFTSASYQYQQYATKGAFLELDDLLEEYAPYTYELIPEGFWEATKINGHIYGVPNYQIVARTTVFKIREELVEKYNIDFSNVKTAEDMEPILAMLKEGETDKKYILSNIPLAKYDTYNYLGLEVLYSLDTPGCIEIDGDGYTVINQYEYPAFVNLAKIAESYADKGYINPDLALIEDPTELMKNGEILVVLMSGYKPGGVIEEATRYGFLAREHLVTDPYVNTTSILGTLTAVSATSKNPERALMLIDQVNSNSDVYNTIVYGIEGKHYNFIGENTIEVIPNSGYSTNVSWMIGNTLNCYLQEGQEAGIYEETKKLNEEAKVSRIMGFSFNAEPVQTEISQCKTVTDKYLKGLECGIYDADEILEQMNEELRAAGMDKIIAEMQAQLDAWVAANK